MDNPFKKIFGQPALHSHLAEKVEIGYSQFGPTLKLAGTLSARDHVTFVNNISLSLLRHTDGAMFIFNWFAFLSSSATTNSETGQDFKMPAKFLISPATPFQYNILFVDQLHYTEMNPILKFLKQNWEIAVEKLPLTATPTDYLRLFESYLKMNFVQEGHSKLIKFCYWEAGEYELNIVFLTREDRPLLELKKSFVLEEADISALKKNSAMIMAELCHQPRISYFSAQAKLKDRA